VSPGAPTVLRGATAGPGHNQGVSSRRPASPSGRRPASRPAGGRPSSGRTSKGAATPAAGRPATGTASGPAGASKSAPAVKGKPAGSGSAASSGKRPAKPRASRRPAGPAREERRLSRHGLVLPEVLTVRLIVLSVVILLAVVLLLPTVRAAVQQSSDIDRLREELALHEAERDRLQVELDRWEDRTYVVERARSRLHYVFPGDTVWRVLDSDTVVEDIDPLTGQPVDAGPVGTDPTSGVPWYQSIWESVQVADGPAASPAPSEAPSPGSSPSPSPSPSPRQ